MKLLLSSLGLIFLLSIAHAQDQVRVQCNQDSMVAQIQKAIVNTAGYDISSIHLNDPSCIFGEGDDPEFFERRVSPLTDCLTAFTVNDSHVEFRNSISSGPVRTGASFPRGVVIGSADMDMDKAVNVLTSTISCTYRIDLRVSTQFIPNITVVTIPIPDVFEIGEFSAVMLIYKDATYRDPYVKPPTLMPADILYVGINIQEEASSDVYLLLERCWGTVYEDPNSLPRYDLIENGCPIRSAGDGRIAVTQNGIGHQALWNGPVFKFVGESEEFNSVWLHCDLKICINERCQPTCPRSRRRRRAAEEVSDPEAFYKGPADEIVITVGPITKVSVVQPGQKELDSMYNNLADGKTMVILPNNAGVQTDEETSSFAPFLVPTIVGVLGSLALIGVILVLMIVFMRLRNSSSNKGVDMTGATNEAYAS